jgi:peptidoglycan/LPS O-acetylase OafA/YrhL
MKFKVLAVFSIVLIILGVASLGTLLQDMSEGMSEDTYLGTTMTVCFLVGGALLYWAARRRYSPGWRMYAGAFLTFFGFVGASIEADSIANLRAEDPVFGFVLAGAFVLAGFLVARSGYWANVRRSSEPGFVQRETGTHRSIAEPVSDASGVQGERAVAPAGSVSEDWK